MTNKCFFKTNKEKLFSIDDIIDLTKVQLRWVGGQWVVQPTLSIFK